MQFARKAAIVSLLAFAACVTGGASNLSPRTPVVDRWLSRAQQSYRGADFDDAREAALAALKLAPHDPQVRVLNAQLALARLDFSEAIGFTEGIETVEAQGIRGRAYWYAGDLEAAADDLENMLRDPAVKDPWAREVAKLARRGTGRHPFSMTGDVVAAVDMPRAGPAILVPVELDGENILALVATSNTEVMLDSNSRRESSWVSLRFGGAIEVHDVPALTQDLAPISRQFGAPIKALLGVNLLRHLHVTFDRRGDQFVVRRADATPPPSGSRVPLWYVRGGAMLMPVNVNGREDGRSLFFVDTSSFFPLGLEEATWRKAGVDPATLKDDPVAANAKTGVVPDVKIGGFDLPRIPALMGGPIAGLDAKLGIDVDGVVGAGVLSLFRVTLTEGGRTMWLEPDPTLETSIAPESAAAAAPKGAK